MGACTLAYLGGKSGIYGSRCPQVLTATGAFMFQIPSKDDPKQLPDPFSDLSVGGWEITDGPVGHLSVWAVSLQGEVRPGGWLREASHRRSGQERSWPSVSFQRCRKEEPAPETFSRPPAAGAALSRQHVTGSPHLLLL